MQTKPTLGGTIPTLFAYGKRIENFTKKIKLMKIVIFTLILGFFALNLTAQNGNCAKEHYDTYLKDAEKALKGAKPDYLAAVNAYSSALAVCPDNAKFVKGKLREIFVEVDKLRVKAEEAEKETKNALAETEKQKQLATDNLAKANKLVNAFYFYEDRFALAYGKKEKNSSTNVFYFIDKNGDEVKKLGKWDKAEQFEWQTGFAYIKKDGKDHILDTMGNTYRVAYDLADMDSSVVALDLSDVQLDSFPTLVLQHTQLQVLILNGYNRGFKTLPTEIAKLQNLKNLQLKSCQIGSLPAQIGELNKLTTLNLGSNKLITLPSQIGELNKLTTLNLEFNQLEELPAQIGELKNLTTLDLSNNKLTSLPAQIGELKNLTTLNLDYNQLTSLPAQIGELKNLTELNLYGNKLTYLPAQIGELKKLTTLYLSDNKLTTLPAQIGELKKLTTLYLSDNKLTTLPAQIGELKKLTTLYLFDNQLTTLPAQIGELKDLTSLGLGSNQLTSLPAQIGELKNLTNLYLGDTQLTTLPAQIGELKNLTDLDLTYNQLTFLPAQIGELKNLTRLDLTYNQLTFLPAQIGELKNLTRLDLRRNELKELPIQIGELKKLNWLDLSGNPDLDFASLCVAFAKNPKKIIIAHYDYNNDINTLLITFYAKLTTLPAQIRELKNLTYLDLSSSELTTLPAEIGELKNLTYLDLSSSELTTLPAQIGELKNLTFLYLDFASLKSLPSSFFTLKVSETLKYEELVKSAINNANFAFAKEIYEGIKDKQKLPNTNYGELSGWFIFTHYFEGAIWAGERYVASGEKEIAYLSYLAMGYLYNGDYEKAKAIYAQYKNEKDSEGKTGKEIFLGDLRAVAEAKVPAKKPAEVEKMMRFLEE